MRSQHVILFFKPYGVLSQFTSEGGKSCLADFGPFPADVYPAGRLDFDSEGLLLLTNDNALKHRLTDPAYGHPRTYLVQVEGAPTPQSIDHLVRGLMIGGKKTRPAFVRLLDSEPLLPPRPVPIRIRERVPTAWLEITLTEGRNRQVRKMTAAAGHPTLRLIRIAIGKLGIEGLMPGDHRSLTSEQVRELRISLGLAAEEGTGPVKHHEGRKKR